MFSSQEKKTRNYFGDRLTVVVVSPDGHILNPEVIYLTLI